MRYNTALPSDLERAQEYFNKVVTRKGIIDIKRVVPKRSLNQNAYLHLLLGAFGQHFGYTMEEAKIVYKDLSPTIYKYEKRGRVFYKSSADLTKDEMTITIERFREASAAQGYELPEATQEDWINQLSNAVESVQAYL